MEDDKILGIYGWTRPLSMRVNVSVCTQLYMTCTEVQVVSRGTIKKTLRQEGISVATYCFCVLEVHRETVARARHNGSHFTDY